MAGNVRRKKFLGEEEVQVLLAATEGEALGKRDRALFGLLYAGGLRVGEVAPLVAQQIDFERRRVVVVGKGRRLRAVPLADAALGWLADYLEDRVTGPVFLAAHGRPMSARLVRKVLDKYARKVALPKVSPHTLRHSSASHMLARGMYLPDLARFLGHRRLQTTAVYLHEVPRKVDLADEYQAAHPLAANAP